MLGKSFNNVYFFGQRCFHPFYSSFVRYLDLSQVLVFASHFFVEEVKNLPMKEGYETG